jgi:hypothetical protein
VVAPVTNRAVVSALFQRAAELGLSVVYPGLSLYANVIDPTAVPPYVCGCAQPPGST